MVYIESGMVEMQTELLKATDLKLMQQRLIRTDPDPQQRSSEPVPTGWHLDTCFTPAHYKSSPRQNYYHTVVARATPYSFPSRSVSSCW
jgi:hypothetical protein